MSRSLIRVLASLLVSFAVVIGWTAAGYPVPSAFAATVPETPSVAEIAATMPPQGDTGWLLEYIVFTMNAEEQAAKAQFETVFVLTAVERTSLQTIAATRQDAVRSHRGSMTAVIGAAIRAQAEQSLATLLGSRYAPAVSWLRDWYTQNMAMRTQQQMQPQQSEEGRSSGKSAVAALRRIGTRKQLHDAASLPDPVH